MANRDVALGNLLSALEEAGLLEEFTDGNGQPGMRGMRDGRMEVLTEKESLEVWALLRFMLAHAQHRGEAVELVAMPQPPEPDFICRVGGSQVIGVEIAHLYGSARDARVVLGRVQPDEDTAEARILHAHEPLSDRIPGDLARLLDQKCAKTYPRTTWLVVRNAYPTWTSEDFARYAMPWSAPERVPFEQIWLVPDRDGLSGLVQLHPEQRLWG